MLIFICHVKETHKYASTGVNENTDLKKIYTQAVYTAEVRAGRPGQLHPWGSINPDFSPGDAMIAPDFLMCAFHGAHPAGALQTSKSAPGRFVRQWVPEPAPYLIRGPKA